MRQRFECLGDNQQRRGTGSVVSSSVVDGITVDGPADSEVIDMGGIDHIFLAEFGVGAGKDGCNVWTGDGFVIADLPQTHRDRQRKSLWFGCIRVSQSIGP